MGKRVTYLNFLKCLESIDAYPNVLTKEPLLSHMDGESKEEYEKLSKDFEMLLFLLRCKDKAEFLGGMKLDGRVVKVTEDDIIRLINSLPRLLNGLRIEQNKLFGDVHGAFSYINNLEDAEEDYLF